jgi:hypothetical protein
MGKHFAVCEFIHRFFEHGLIILFFVFVHQADLLQDFVDVHKGILGKHILDVLFRFAFHFKHNDIVFRLVSD